MVADAGGGGWPESMTRELQACRTPQERNAWAEKWGKVLSGEAQREKRGGRRSDRRAAGQRIVGLSRPKGGACVRPRTTIEGSSENLPPTGIASFLIEARTNVETTQFLI